MGMDEYFYNYVGEKKAMLCVRRGEKADFLGKYNIFAFTDISQNLQRSSQPH